MQFSRSIVVSVLGMKARLALALSVVGAMAVMVVWNLMLFFY
jgi:hypothetical protein